MHANGHAISDRPAKSGRSEAERARLRYDRHFGSRKAAGQSNTDTVPKRIAARQYSHIPAAALGNRLDRAVERALPDESFGAVLRDHAEVASAANQHLGGLDERARRSGETGYPVLADPDYGEPGSHSVLASALTAAAASELPPRRPLSVI